VRTSFLGLAIAAECFLSVAESRTVGARGWRRSWVACVAADRAGLNGRSILATSAARRLAKRVCLSRVLFLVECRAFWRIDAVGRRRRKGRSEMRVQARFLVRLRLVKRINYICCGLERVLARSPIAVPIIAMACSTKCEAPSCKGTRQALPACRIHLPPWSPWPIAFWNCLMFGMMFF
jgi:hypothetical protein